MSRTSETRNAVVADQQTRIIPVALVQFDAVPEQVARNLGEIERLAEQAAAAGARWIMFHEGTLCDYTPRFAELAETVPVGKSVRRIERLARRLGCYLAYGLTEEVDERYYISHVFTGPRGFIYRYRKTWIWHEDGDRNYRDEWSRYDVGTGPETFALDGVKATCFICSDGEARRCIQRAAELEPEVVFYPNNRSSLCDARGEFSSYARMIGAPLLSTNRVGSSWQKPTAGGCMVHSASGELLASANSEGREEILRYDLRLSTR